MAVAAKCTALLLLATVLATAHGYRKRRCLGYPTLVCHFAPIGGSSISGSAKLSPKWLGNRFTGRCATKIVATVYGLTSAKQGWHIHEFGDVSDPAGLATGPHYANPHGKATMPGLPGDKNRHWGDIGNLHDLNGDGKAVHREIDTTIRSTKAVLGRSIVVHLNEDLGRVTPNPGSGPRIAQCVLGLANTSK